MIYYLWSVKASKSKIISTLVHYRDIHLSCKRYVIDMIEQLGYDS